MNPNEAALLHHRNDLTKHPILPKIFWDYKGEEMCIEETALATLLYDGVLFCNERDTTFQGKPCGSTTVLYVNCNDMFAWACADAEDLPNDQIGTLYKMHMADKCWGSAKWCCIQRNQKPQPPVERDMRKDGVWDDVMENLGSNIQDVEVQAQFAAFAKGEKA